MHRGDADDGDDDGDAAGGLFSEPEGYYKEEVGKSQTLTRPAGKGTLSLQLAAKHSLWGHEVWNASRYVADAIDTGALPVAGCTVLELGAGAGLPSFVAALNGAARVVVTDYETAADTALTDVLRANAAALSGEGGCLPAGVLAVEGFVWGRDTAPLLQHLRGVLPAAGRAPIGGGGGAAEARGGDAAAPQRLFDRILLCDLLFNRQSHRALLATCAACLERAGVVWVSYSHHDPHKAPLDDAFFPLAREAGFRTTHVADVPFERDLFEEGDGLDHLRAIVHFWTLERARETCAGGPDDDGDTGVQAPGAGRA